MSSSTTTMAHDRRFTKHGFPKGFRFVPTNLELAIILALKVHGRRLHHKVANIFHELDILDYHPQELHDMFELDKEHRFIYFFSQRKSAGAASDGLVHKKRQRGGGGQDEDENAPRPVRLARGGGWKPSGGGQVLRWPKDKGGFVAGKMVTMVFYDHHDGGEPVKTHWGMHEVVVPTDPRLQLDKPNKRGAQFHTLALYRLYKIKSDDTEIDDGGAGSINPTMANVSAANGHFSAPAGQPSFGIFTGRNQNQPPAGGATSTSRMPPPHLQLQQHRIPNLGHPQYYHHHQYAFGAGHQRPVNTMALSSAYGTGMLPGRQLFPFARQPGITGLPGPQSLQFARPPAPSQMMPVLPAAGNLASSHQQGPAKPATYSGAGQQASHPRATRMPPSTPPAVESPWLEELAPMTAATPGGDFGATRSSPATGSRQAEQDATAMAEPGQHVQFADCVKPEETVPSLIPADSYDGIGMLDMGMELGMFDENCLFTMDELCPTFDEPPPTQQEDNN